MFFSDFLMEVRRQLRDILWVDHENLESRLIISQAMGITENNFFLINPDREVPQEAVETALSIIRERKEGRSLASLLGYKFFYDSKFYVNRHVLIPRPETEFLVDCVLELIRENEWKQAIEIGAGSGCVAISIIKNSDPMKMDALEISPEAMEVFGQNLQLHGLSGSDRIVPILGDLFHFSPEKEYELVLSNPPYIPTEIAAKIIETHEADDPALALDGGVDGLHFYRELFSFCVHHLKRGGHLVIEHGFDQADKMKEIFDRTPLSVTETVKDYGGKPRVTTVRKG